MSGKQKSRLAESNLVSNRSPLHTRCSAWGIERKACAVCFLFTYNSIMFPWEREEKGGRRVTAEGYQEWCSLSSWFVHPDGEGRKKRCKWKNVWWETWVEVMLGGISGVGLADVDGQVFTEVHKWVCLWKKVAETMCSCQMLCDLHTLAKLGLWQLQWNVFKWFF